MRPEIEDGVVQPELGVGTAVAAKEDVDHAPVEYQPSGGMDVQALMQVALERDGAIDVIKELVQLRNDEMARQAKRDFHTAFAEFKRLCPPIPRDCRGKELASRDGTQKTTLMYSGLETIQRVVDPILFSLGFSYSWTVPNASERSLKVVCYLQHESGHMVESQMVVPVSSIPQATPSQEFAGARTTGKRLTLSDVLGIATDDDQESEDGGFEPIEEDALREIRALVQVKDVDIDKFLAFVGVESLKDIPRASYGMAMRFLQTRKDRPS